MEKIVLQHNKGYAWKTSGNFVYKGFSTVENLKANKAGFTNFLAHQASPFALIYEDNQKIMALMDGMRSFPLFYHHSEKGLFLSDQVDALLEDVPKIFNPKQISFFKKAAYTSGKNTLIQDVFVMQQRELLCYDKKDKTLQVHTLPIRPYPLTKNLLKDFKNMSDTVFAHLFSVLKNKTAVVPLSGGWDSRLILSALIDLKHPNILCYTYGKKDSDEVRIAQKIVQKHQIKWHFVEYRPQIIQQYCEPEGLAYDAFAAQYTAVAYEQDFFAVQYLHYHNLLPKNAVFLPGYCGDFFAGSKLLKTIPSQLSLKSLTNVIVKMQNFGALANDLLKLLMDVLKDSEIHDAVSFQKAYLDWYAKHKSDKFINNGARAFEFFNYQWIAPFAHPLWMQFFNALPLAQKQNKKFYKKAILKYYFSPLGIDFNMGSIESSLHQNKMFGRLKNSVGKTFKNKVKSFLNWDKDVNNSSCFIQTLQNNQSGVYNHPDENIVHANWYIQKLKQ